MGRKMKDVVYSLSKEPREYSTNEQHSEKKKTGRRSWGPLKKKPNTGAGIIKLDASFIRNP